MPAIIKKLIIVIKIMTKANMKSNSVIIQNHLLIVSHVNILFIHTSLNNQYAALSGYGITFYLFGPTVIFWV